MTKDKTYDPFEGIKQISEMWERQVNGLLYMLTDNKEFVRTAQVGLEAHSRYMELLKKNQEFMAGIMNIPTKSEVANVAKLSIQAEEKLDCLEERIWEMEDKITEFRKENIEQLHELAKDIKQMKTEFTKAAGELTEMSKLKTDLQEIRQTNFEIKILQVKVKELRKEIANIVERDEIREAEESSMIGSLKTEVLELKQGISQLSDLKKEITSVKNIMKKEKEKGKEKEKEKEKELVLTGTNTARA
jgi:chromosome segregation ATPase